MYYPDLTCYRIGDDLGRIAKVYPNQKNIGWLQKDYSYTKGTVEEHLIQKLKELLFFKWKNIEDEKNGLFDENKAVMIHDSGIRGPAETCSFCNNLVITIYPDNLRYYHGTMPKKLGKNEIAIPSLKEKEFYVFPTMLYHYIVEHKYKPPQEFLDALEAFDLEKPYNFEKEVEKVFIEIEMTAEKVNSFVPSK